VNEIILNSNIHDRLLNTVEKRKGSGLDPNQMLCLRSAPLGQVVGDTATTRLQARLQAAQPRQGFKEDSVYLFTFLTFQILAF
jgi:hypothetical protein